MYCVEYFYDTGKNVLTNAADITHAVFLVFCVFCWQRRFWVLVLSCLSYCVVVFVL